MMLDHHHDSLLDFLLLLLPSPRLSSAFLLLASSWSLFFLGAENAGEPNSLSSFSLHQAQSCNVLSKNRIYSHIFRHPDDNLCSELYCIDSKNR